LNWIREITGTAYVYYMACFGYSVKDVLYVHQVTDTKPVK